MADIPTRNFSVLNLCHPEKRLPTAVPLILQSNYQWNPAEHSVTKLHDCDEKDVHLNINEEALALLKTIRKPVAVLTLCGPARTGKSYFISRMVGKPGSFKVGHSMEACTRGIWLSTIALECDEFVLLLLDTEGIGIVKKKGSNSIVTKILVNTVLVSSLLVYNSMEVPTRNDLQQMSFFAHLSSSISINDSTKHGSSEELNKYFPQLMWLFRDVVRFPVKKMEEIEEDDEKKNSDDEESEEEGEDNEEERYECLQKYLNSEVLATTGGVDSNTANVVESIRTLFPQPLLCQWLPPPSENSEVLQNIENDDNLDKMFVKRINKVICHLKNIIRPKIGFDMKTIITGKSMAAMMQTYTDVLNKDDSVLSLQESWLAVIELAISDTTRNLKEEYEMEMESRTVGKLPMEEMIKETDEASITLFGLHHEILEKKCEALNVYLNELLANVPEKDELIDKTVSSFESDIVVKKGERVIGGLLLKFITANYKESKDQCEKIWNDIVKKKDLDEGSQEALNKSDANLSKKVCDDIEKLNEEYNEKAVGPARESVELYRDYWSGRKKILQSIPGPPTDIKAVGKTKNSLKLSWNHPEVHRNAAKKYIVKMKNGENWDEITTVENNSYIVKDLKPNTKYEFKVASWNDEHEANLKGEIEESTKTGTRLGPLARATLCALGFASGTVMAPVLVPAAIPVFAAKVEKTKEKTLLAAFIATNPFIATFGAPVIGATVAYQTFKETGDWGDMEEDDETPDDYASSQV